MAKKKKFSNTAKGAGIGGVSGLAGGIGYTALFGKLGLVGSSKIIPYGGIKLFPVIVGAGVGITAGVAVVAVGTTGYMIYKKIKKQKKDS